MGHKLVAMVCSLDKHQSIHDLSMMVEQHNLASNLINWEYFLFNIIALKTMLKMSKYYQVECTSFGCVMFRASEPMAVWVDTRLMVSTIYWSSITIWILSNHSFLVTAWWWITIRPVSFTRISNDQCFEIFRSVKRFLKFFEDIHLPVFDV